MSSHFNVVYTGLQEGITDTDFIENFCSQFGLDKKKAQNIVESNSDVVIKKNLSKEKATQYRTAFEECGMIIKLVPTDEKPISIEKNTPPPASPIQDSNNPYATPKASLTINSINKEGQGSLEGGLKGDYDFTIGDIYRESWEKTKGVKGKFLLAWTSYMGVAFGISWFFYFVNIDSMGLIENLINVPILYPLMAGITLMGIQHSVGADIYPTSIWNHYKKVLPISLLTVLMLSLIGLGMLLLIIPGIYLGIAYMMALSLMMDRNMGVWESLETSRKAITKHWFKLFFIYLLLFLLIIVAMLPLFIGLIWVLPMSSVMQGILYKHIFGVESVE